MSKILKENNPQKWLEIKTHPYYKLARERLNEVAWPLLREPIKAMPYSKFKLFWETGDRKEYETGCYSALINRVTAFSLLAKITEDESYIAGVEDALWALCDTYTWSYPAHLKYDVPGGYIKLELEKEETWIDLSVAETAFGICEVLDILEDGISTQVSWRVKQEIQKRVILPFLNREKQYQWEDCKHNWAAVCGGSLIMVFLYQGTVQQIEEGLPQLMRCMDSYLEGIEDDCYCKEGCNYWSYGFGYFTVAAEGLRQYSNGEIDYFKLEKVRRFAAYPQRMILNDGKCANFADSEEIFRRYPGVAHFLTKEYNNIYIPEKTYYADMFWGGHSRIPIVIRDLLWTDTNIKEEPLKKEMQYFEVAGVYIQHKQGYDFAAKAGHNGEPHNHNDVGQFIISVDGYSVLSDLPGGGYTKDYFDPKKRYQLVTPSSLGHNLPIVNGAVQCAGKEYSGAVLNADENTFKVEISKAYAKESGLALFEREFILSDSKVKISNKYVFNKKVNKIVEHFVSERKPELDDGGVLIGRCKLKLGNLSVEPYIACKSINKAISYYTIEFIIESDSEEIETEFIIEVL